MSYLIKTRSKYRAHELIKRFVSKQVVANDFQHKIYKSSLEKSFGERRADIYFYYKNGKKVVVEIQNSPITSKEIIARTKDYNKKNLYVLWILNGQGKCIGDPKTPKHLKNLKISPVEIRLHQIYQGRVYYMNVSGKNGLYTITKPFALHFTDSEKYSNKIMRKDHKYFFIQNAYSTFIPNWNIFLKTSGSYKIARFYDKNFVIELANKIRFLIYKFSGFQIDSLKSSREIKNIYNMITTHLDPTLGETAILEAFQYLVNTNQLIFNPKYLIKQKKKLNKKLKIYP